MERVAFRGRLTLEANHHCGIDITGMLCYPLYLFLNCHRRHLPV